MSLAPDVLSLQWTLDAMIHCGQQAWVLETGYSCQFIQNCIFSSSELLPSVFVRP